MLSKPSPFATSCVLDPISSILVAANRHKRQYLIQRMWPKDESRSSLERQSPIECMPRHSRRGARFHACQ